MDSAARALALKASSGSSLLDANGKLISSALPDSILGSVNYRGTWDASANTPTIPTAATANKGYYYVVSVAGNTTINSINTWDIGNWIISDGTQWSKIATTQKVSSVSNKTGAVMLDKTDVNLGNVDNVQQIPLSQKATALGVATLDLNSKLVQMPTKTDIGLSNVTNDAQIPLSQKGTVSGVATLDASGKVPVTQIPIAAANVVSVANQTARLAIPKNTTNLTLALQADTQWMWALNENLDPSVLSNWIDCGTTANTVVSVNGATGAVTVSCASLGAVPTTTKINNKALGGDISLTINDLLTLTNTGTKFLCDTGAWVNVATVIDNSSSHYMDVGGMRIQWGNTTGTTITFPVPFKDTSYTCNPTVELNNNGTLTSVFITSKSPTGVALQKSWYNGGSWGTSLTCNVGWIAIGLKP